MAVAIASGKPELLPQRSKDRDGAEGQCRGGHQFLGLAQQLLLLHVPGKSIGKFFEGAAGDQFVEAPEVGDDLLADASAFPVRLDNLEILPLRSVFPWEGEASQKHELQISSQQPNVKGYFH